MQISRRLWASALGLLWLCGALVSAGADPPPAAEGSVPAESTSGEAQVSESKGGYATSLRQAFEEDPTREVVRGHFEQGTPPHTHRYYCLVDPKTGKTEPNGVAGQLVKRRDGMTGIQDPAVSPLSCADAQQKGLLVTTGYVVKGRAAGPVAVPAAASTGSATASPAGSGAAQPMRAAPAAPPASVAAPVLSPPQPAAAGPVDSSVQTEILAVFARFIFAENAHDHAAVAEVLLNSKDFVLAEYGGNPVWGYQEAMDALESQWRGTSRLDPQLKELHVVSPAAGVAVLITPLLQMSGAAGRAVMTVAVRWSGVFVKTASGWRIAAIFTAPLKDAAKG
jgi:hypothetical protein